MEEGLSFESFAAQADTCKPTLYSWAEKFPDFLNAKRRGTEKCRAFWERMGRDNAVTTGDKKLNAAVWLFNMKNRFRDEWTDQKNITIVDNTKDKEELQALKERLASERKS